MAALADPVVPDLPAEDDDEEEDTASKKGKKKAAGKAADKAGGGLSLDVDEAEGGKDEL